MELTDDNATRITIMNKYLSAILPPTLELSDDACDIEKTLRFVNGEPWKLIWPEMVHIALGGREGSSTGYSSGMAQRL
jgi:hypothetical protein